MLWLLTGGFMKTLKEGPQVESRIRWVGKEATPVPKSLILNLSPYVMPWPFWELCLYDPIKCDTACRRRRCSGC